LLENGAVYIGYSSHCDSGRYHGYLFAYGAGSLRRIAAFDVTPTGNGGSIWMSGQGPAAGPRGHIYFPPATEPMMDVIISPTACCG